MSMKKFIIDFLERKACLHKSDKSFLLTFKRRDFCFETDHIACCFRRDKDTMRASM